jgi:hypothetical protein
MIEKEEQHILMNEKREKKELRAKEFQCKLAAENKKKKNIRLAKQVKR